MRVTDAGHGLQSGAFSMMVDDDGAVYAIRNANLLFESFFYPEPPHHISGNIAQFISSMLTSSVRFNGRGWESNIAFLLSKEPSFSFHHDRVSILMEYGDVL